MTVRGAVAPVILLALTLGWRSARATPDVYEPGLDPVLGFNLISWANFGTSGTSVWENAVQDIYDHGFRAVSISPLRFVDLGSGGIYPSDGTHTGPDTSHIAAAIARGHSLGMSVTVNPFVEPDGFSMWRGQMNFSGAAKTQFWNDYRAYLVEIASIAQTNGADRITVGTELDAIVADPSHNPDWADVIDAVDGAFGGQVGYASNWGDYQDPNLTTTLWENSKIDFIGVDTYHPLATDLEATGPGNPSVAALEQSWTSVFDNPGGGFNHGILPFAAARKGGAGMPYIMTEHGTVPYDKTTVAPYSATPSGTPEPEEQRNDYDALVRAADHRGAPPVSDGHLQEIHIWHWGMPGAEGSRWYLDPEGDDVTTGAQAAGSLVAFVATGSTTSTVTSTTVATTTTTVPAEICGNCLDDDGNGLTDFEDPACCGGATGSLMLARALIRPGGATSGLRLASLLPAILPDLTGEAVFLQLRPEGGAELLCAEIPPGKFIARGRGFVFADEASAVPSARGIQKIRVHSSTMGSAKLSAAGQQVLFPSPGAGLLRLTLGFQHSAAAAAEFCVATVEQLRADRNGNARFP